MATINLLRAKNGPKITCVEPKIVLSWPRMTFKNESLKKDLQIQNAVFNWTKLEGKLSAYYVLKSVITYI